MANTIGYVVGYHKDGSRQASQASRLGSAAVMANANTYHTFATAHVNADGHGYVTVARDGKTIHHFAFGPEGDASAKAKADNGD